LESDELRPSSDERKLDRDDPPSDDRLLNERELPLSPERLLPMLIERPLLPLDERMLLPPLKELPPLNERPLPPSPPRLPPPPPPPPPPPSRPFCAKAEPEASKPIKVAMTKLFRNLVTRIAECTSESACAISISPRHSTLEILVRAGNQNAERQSVKHQLFGRPRCGAQASVAMIGSRAPQAERYRVLRFLMQPPCRRFWGALQGKFSQETASKRATPFWLTSDIDGARRKEQTCRIKLMPAREICAHDF
jgi:hypothetical protein